MRLSHSRSNVNSPFGLMLAHNGNLTNADQLKQADVFAGPAAYEYQFGFRGAAERARSRASGGLPEPLSKRSAENSFSVPWLVCSAVFAGPMSVARFPATELAFRDPYGIRPLVIGRNDTEHGPEFL